MNEQRYRQLFERLNALYPANFKRQQEIQSQYDAELAQDYKSKFPKRKYNPGKRPECPNQEAIFAKYKAIAQEQVEQYNKNEAEIKAELDALAANLPVWKSEELQLQYEVSQVSYNSQGFGAARYARANAESRADLALACGLQAEVRPIQKDGYLNYGVYVNTDSAGWDLIERKPDVPLKEWLKNCWKRGVNPRVYNPFLPVGLEEQLGLDYFGGEVKHG